MEGIRFLSFGKAVPDKTVSNDDLSQIVDTSDEWISVRTGIKQRYVSEKENTSDLAYRAAEECVQKAGINTDDIQFIIVATITPDNFTPSCACMVQEKLGLKDKEITAFDINAACSGFIFALRTACSMLSENKYALVIGAETLSKIIDWSDRSTCILFGDGAGAALIKKENTDKKVCFYTKTIPDTQKALWAEGIPLNPLTNIQKNYSYLTMEGQDVFRFAVRAMEEVMDNILLQSNCKAEDIDLVIPHQANIRIIRAAAKKLGISEDKFFVNLENYGNTSAASVAIALCESFEKGIIKPGMKVVLLGFGAGFSCGGMYVEF